MESKNSFLSKIGIKILKLLKNKQKIGFFEINGGIHNAKITRFSDWKSKIGQKFNQNVTSDEK